MSGKWWAALNRPLPMRRQQIAELQAAIGRLDPFSNERVPLPRAPELAALATSFNDMADRLLVSTKLIAENENRLRVLFAHASDVVMVIRPDTTIVSATPSVERLLGVDASDLVGRAFLEWIAPDDEPVMLAALASNDAHEPIEFRLTHSDGRLIIAETHIVDLTAEPAVQGLVLTLRDISERKELEDLLAHQAFHDALTGLPNRALLRDRLAHALYRRGATRPLGLLFLDLNDFKTVNDSLGHFAGDALLQIVAARLELQLRAGDTAARIGGDEFVILLEDADETEAVEVAFRIREALNEPANLVDIDVYPQASIGVAVGRPGFTSAEELLAQADAAMYIAKASEGVCLYGEELRINVLRRLELKTELQRALARGELSVHYQPVIDLATGRIAGVEALARWVHPTLGPIMPDDFIPLAEETGLISEIGRDILLRACQQLAQWQRTYLHLAPGFLTVNVSGRQLIDPSLLDDVQAALDASGIQPAQLILEITESVMFSNDEPALERLHELKAIGVRLAIDDFGTGYSSLAYLQRLPVDILKLDKNFVDELERGKLTASAIANAIVDLGHNLKLQVIAEGIETDRQARLLRNGHCDYGQGYLFDRPLPAEQLALRLVLPHALLAAKS
jgi:diguanylate cyclase (GGDEF)-like protein/PAS domain S-box-containing protein